jgi:hypothetical protein
MKEYWVNVYYYAGIIYGDAELSRRFAHEASLGSPFKLVYRIHVIMK